MSSPSSETLPVNGTKPVTASISVVLPAPFGPIRPSSSPSRTSRSTASRAWTPPNATDSPVTDRTGTVAARGEFGVSTVARRKGMAPNSLNGIRLLRLSSAKAYRAGFRSGSGGWTAGRLWIRL